MAMRSKLAGMWATRGSPVASFMFFWAIIHQYCPHWVRRYFRKCTNRIMSFFNRYIKICIHEITGDRLRRSEAYAAVEAYLGLNCSKTAKSLKAEIGQGSTNLLLTMDEYGTVADEFGGAKVWWVSSKVVPPSSPMGYYPDQEKRYYRLTFHKRYREIITEAYLQHVLREGKEITVRNRRRKLYTNIHACKQSGWSHIVFEHPATFETMALEPEKKQEIVDDLVTFSKSKDFYARIGKAWKRGYLLYGPPGTGKSTMIAAMANLLNYDIYDLELTAVQGNTELRKLLIGTTSKSIIVIEDIDCSLDLTGNREKKKKEKSPKEGEKLDEEGSCKEPKEERSSSSSSSSKVTLSGLLNFIDGIWSACGGERLIVFTTNYVDKLDPALIRRGRMDKRIELSYCSFEGFRVLAKNYLNLETHPMFDVIKGLMTEAKITPADLAENLMPNSPSDDAEKCLSNLIRALEEAVNEADRRKAKKQEAAGMKAEKEEATGKAEKEEAGAKITDEEETATADKAQDRAEEQVTTNILHCN